MRDRFSVILAALLLATALPARAQTPPTMPLPADVPSVGLADIGVRAGDTDGDEARLERYRDLRPGATTLFSVDQRTDRYLFEASASNVGYRDQRYTAGYTNGRLTLSGLFDSIPLNYLNDAPYIWRSDGNGTMTLDQQARLQVENRQAVGVPCSAGSGPTSCNANTSGAALANRSIYNQFISNTDMQVRRDIFGVKVAYLATPALSFDVDASTTGRSGEMPWNASFAFSNTNQFAVPIDQRNNELKLGSEWVNQRGMIRLDYWGSYFTNDIQTLTWDNPVRATDFNNGRVPPLGPWDPSAYSNGNGPAVGQSALWPSNTLNSFGITGLYRDIPKTTINGNLQFTYMRQNEALLPWSLNSTINNDLTLSAFPNLRQLPRPTAEAAINGMNWLVNLSSRPTPFLTIQARYRYNDHNNNTPHFDGREYVRFDGVPEEFTDDPNTPYLEGFSEYFDITRKNFDANGTFKLRDFGSLRLGYANEMYERHGRGFSDVSEHTFRLAYDANLAQMVTVRASLDSSRRRGDGYILAGVDYEQGPAGTQPGLRYYDEADRDRTRGSVIFSVNPVSMASVFVQFATTRDTFLGDEFIPEGRDHFGLINQDSDAVVFGADVSPFDMAHFGVSYGWDKYRALQRSRNASPPPNPNWTDPNFNWELDNEEVVNTFMAYLDLLGLANAKADLRFSYEFNDSDGAFNYGGPRIASLQTAGTFIPLPNVVNQWNRFTADLKYFVSANFGIGVGYWYEKLDMDDWATIDSNGSVGFTPATGQPRIDYLGGLMTGYGSRPYSGGRFFVRALYRF